MVHHPLLLHLSANVGSIQQEILNNFQNTILYIQEQMRNVTLDLWNFKVYELLDNT